MSQSESNQDNRSASRSAESALKEIIENRLHEAGVRVARCASVEEGTKACYNHDDQRPPTEVEGNYTVHGGDGLVLFDIDVPLDELPEWVRDLPSAFVVESPHGGYHLYYCVENDTGVSNTHSVPWGSIRYQGEYVVGPGSKIDHALCDDGKDGCPGEGIGEYVNEVNKPIANLTGEDLDRVRDVCNSGAGNADTSEEYGGEKITLPDDDLADEAIRYICSEFTQRADSGDAACTDMMDLSRGGTGTYELRRDNNPQKIDQSAADYYTLEMYKGAFLFRGEDDEDARRLTLAAFKRFCRENPYDKTGTLRKWLRKGEGYLQEQMGAVEDEFDWDDWNRWRRREYEDGFDASEQKPWADPAKDGVPSLIVQDTVRATLHILTSDLDAEYVARRFGVSIPPTISGEMFTPLGSTSPGSSSGDSRQYPVADEVGEVAESINPERQASTFSETLKKLSRETDEVAMAYCPSRPNGERFVYYPASLPDPEDARWVKVGGEKREPEPEQPEESAETDVMTDGGTRMERSEAKRDIERVRQVREENTEPTEEPELHRCPIEGCTRTVIDNPSGLRSHVRQSGDAAHEGKILTENLEVEVDEESYHANWGPGVRDGPPPEQESIYAEYEGEWGPGALKSEVQS